MWKIEKILSLSLYRDIYKIRIASYELIEKYAGESAKHHKRARTHVHVHKRTRWRCMPASVIDISKYAMADRSRRVLVRTTTALPTLPRTNAPARRFYRTLHPSRTRLGKFSENHVREFPLVDGKSIYRYCQCPRDNCQISQNLCLCKILPAHFNEFQYASRDCYNFDSVKF